MSTSDKLNRLIDQRPTGRPVKGPGPFRWRWRLGLFENALQVANWLRVRHGLTVEDSLDLVCTIQDDLFGKETAPRLIYDEALRRLKAAREELEG